MHPDSRQIIYMGINFVMSPMPTIDMQSNLNFQQSLVKQGIDFTKAELKEREIVVVREALARLEIKVAAVSPPSIGQLLIVAPRRDLTLFAKEAQAIVEAFDSTWPAKNRQVISSDATLRDLYETSAEHAFQELWEMHLGQSRAALSALGRPVLGGGLRFVMPPQPDDSEPVQIEVKIESFLRDTRKIYVETQFKWPQPMPPGTPLDPENRLNQVNDYVKSEVISFIVGGSHDRS
ncbi:MAG: hypothetical protein ACE5JP_07935 [Candidatus Bipolaricaulia bacterium]